MTRTSRTHHGLTYAVATAAVVPGSVEPDEMEKAISFRLSLKEHSALKREGRCSTTLSRTLRSMLVTHLLVGRERITSATFQGGFRATRSGATRTWRVVDDHDKILLGGLDRDSALLRCEWIAQAAIEATRKPRATRTAAFRLSSEEHAALADLAAVNRTTVSAALRSFLVTSLIRRTHRLLAVSFTNCHAYSEPDGWCVAVGPDMVAAWLSREDALQRADWLSEARHAAAS